MSFLPPARCKEIKRPGTETIVEYLNEDNRWLLRVSRATFPTPVQLMGTRKDGQDVPGLLEYTVGQLKKATPGAKVVREDLINVDSNYVGMIALRFTLGTQKFLRQHAMLQVNDQLYYIFNFTTPAGNVPANPQPGAEDALDAADPSEKQAVDTFTAMIDSIKLLDRTVIKDDQNQRLYRTRHLFMFWTEKKFASILIPKQYFRIIQDGRDVGYTYLEESLESQDMSGLGIKGASVYARSHIKERDDAGHEGVVDVGTFQFMAFDRKHESWTRAVVRQSKSDKDPQEMHTTEFGTSVQETRSAYVKPEAGVQVGNDARNQPVRPYEVHSLDVSIVAKSETPEPVHADLPPFYLPQAGGHFLPRLVVDLTFREPRTYLFASYIAEKRAVMMRYVDVSEEKDINFGGRKALGYIVSEKLGLEGAVTTHYVTRDGVYLGSENKEQKLLTLPSDEATILKMWPKALLTRPEKIQQEKSGTAPVGANEQPPARGLPPALR